MVAKRETPPRVEPPTLGFATAEAFEAWLADHRAEDAGLWLRLAKKGSGLESVSYAEAVQVALCYGWIGGRARESAATRPGSNASVPDGRAAAAFAALSSANRYAMICQVEDAKGADIRARRIAKFVAELSA